MSKIHEEDRQIFNFILDNLIVKVQNNVTEFSCDMDDEYEEMSWEDDKDEQNTFMGRVKTFRVTWTSGRSRKSDYVTFRFTPAYGTVSIQISTNGQNSLFGGLHDNGSREIKVGHGPEHKDIKIKIMKIYRAVEFYQETEIPRRQREAFINNVTQIFPNLFDNIILGGEDDEEED